MSKNPASVADGEVGGVDLLEALLALGLAGSTIALYVRTIQRAETWFLAEGANLATASATLVAAYAEMLPPSWSNRNLLRAAFGHYWRLVDRSNPPIRALRVPPQPEGTCKALEEDDARLLAKYAASVATSGDRRGLAVLFGLYTALRRAEIAALRWSDFASGDMRVVGKGRKEARLPVHSKLQSVIDAWPGERSGFLFAGRVDGHVGPSTVWQWSLDLADEAGIAERVSTHRLRHTALATANDKTGDLRATSALARHSKIQTTMIYTRTKSRRLRATVEAIDYDE